MLYFGKWAALNTILEGGAWFSLLCTKPLQSKEAIYCWHNITVASTRCYSGMISGVMNVHPVLFGHIIHASRIGIVGVPSNDVTFISDMHRENLSYTTVKSWAVLLVFQWGHMWAKQIWFAVLLPSVTSF